MSTNVLEKAAESWMSRQRIGTSGSHALAVCFGVGFVLSLVACAEPEPSLPAREGAVREIATGDPFGPRMTVFEDTASECVACELRLVRIASFGRAEDPILLRDIPIVERDGLGRFYATVSRAYDHEVVVYDSGGAIVRTIGGHGSGPGEFRVVWDILIGVDDTIYVDHDRGISVFDSAGTFVRSIRLSPPAASPWPDPRRLVHVSSAGLVLNSWSTAPDIAVRPFHLYDWDGRHVEAFGSPDLLADYRARSGGLPRAQRIHAAASDGSIWSAPLTLYRLEYLDRNRHPRRVIGVTPDWHTRFFMTVEEAEASMANDPPGRLPLPAGSSHYPRPERLQAPPYLRVAGIAVLAANRLAVAVHVAALEWESARITYDARYPDEPQWEPGVRQQMFDTILDIIDTDRGTVVARKRFRGRAFLTRRDGILIHPWVHENGIIKVEAFRIQLLEPA